MTRTNLRAVRSRSVPLVIALAGVVGVALPASIATAQDSQAKTRAVNPKHETLMRLSRNISIDLESQRLEDVVMFVASYTGATIDALWLDDNHAEGLDPEMEVTLKAEDIPAITLIERLMLRAGEDAGDPAGYTWQLASDGSLEVGPKDRLNSRKILVMYDINDMIIEIPDYSDAPEFDLQSVLQNSTGGGGGGGSSPFTGQSAERDITPKEDRARDIIAIVTALIEPEQWVDNGGDGASVRFFQNNLIVRAPDYIHRQLNGYAFWPRNLTRATYSDGRRNTEILPDPAMRKRGP